MVIFLATIVGLSLWIILWGIGATNSFDAFMLTILIILIACAAHIVAPYLPGNRGDDHPPPGA